MNSGFCPVSPSTLVRRIKTKFRAEAASREELAHALELRLAAGGNASLMTDGLIHTLIEHGMGNHRVVMQTCEEILLQNTDSRAVAEEKDGTTAQRFQRGGLLALKAGALRSRNMLLGVY